ncbi:MULTISPECIES: ROK family transcriptional regulator [Streptomyces]|jgi:predicted NBD/HSP70 family sugar kinase|uniref:ROK family transcriptional regulator n=1 Tax=Streptomyces sp. 900116325 TaxID=3154295 RepID=A0ABV2U1R0_9ACTN|nr:MULTISPECIES: ROK family transcriptional regulator [unclassified Streptomyces]MDX2732963.1 ROK family transcriptional regulator [Streptomyces sp. PA03-2a]MDX3767992.1 ROK family transcriptional regulator [Streptomyces sp. AK08-01B]MDX3821005.1 ROK family transcriptional regulator [Streptomyces sp. AK08-01A]SCY98171.1 Sugar kinase of the NBD/HSP70 family, may contain an N-terminal HTH domain [Streptomyces sp. 136MFCol5.1]SFT03524.1 Sugar kinase of the NBD/HSP70 family, may contain an N-termi
METPGSQTSLHRANLERVVRAVRMAGSLTQAEIARGTGLSAATVSNIVRELKDGGTVEVTPTSAGGRRARSVSLSGDAGIVIGVDFGHTHLRVAVGNLAHQVLAEESEPLDVDASSAQGFGRAEQLVKRLIETTGISPGKVIGVGLGVPGPIDVESGTLGSTSILPGWTGINPSEELAARLGVPVYVDNDANLGALGELVWGSGRGVKDLAYIKVASGVGAGLVIDGHIYRGPGGTAGEIGHITLDESGPVCRCGNRGCLETFTAARYVLPLLRPSHGPDLTMERVVQLAREGDPGCRRVIGDVGRHIGSGVANLCNLLNPSRVVLGGSLAEAGELVLAPIRDSVSRYAIPSAGRQLSVLPGALGARAEVLGALALVLSEMGDSTLLESTLPTATPAFT